MPQHLKQVHRGLSKEEITQLSKMAKIVKTPTKRGQKNFPRLKGQSQLAHYSRGKAQEPDPYAGASGQKSTRTFPSFPLGQSDELEEFQDWLQGLEGKQRSPSQAKEIATDVSKALW